MSENLRNMIVSIGFDVPKSPLADLNKEMQKFTGNTFAAGAAMKGMDNSFTSSNRAMVKESQVFNKQVTRQTDFIRRLSKTAGMSATHMADSWSLMTDEMRMSLITNHNQMLVHRKDLLAVKGDMRNLGMQMGHYSGTTADFTKEVNALGKRHKKISDEMINSNLSMRQSMIQTVGTLNAMSTQSEKIGSNYDRMGKSIYKVNKPLLTITSGLETMAKRGNAAALALKLLGPNAKMKQLADMQAIINQGMMRYTMVALAALAAGALFYSGLHKAARDSVPGYAKTFDEMAGSIRKAIQPLVDVFAMIMVPVFKFIKGIADMVISFNKAHPVLSKLIAGFLVLIPILTLILAPLSIGIGLFAGMQAAMATVWPIIGPMVVGFGAMMGTVLLVSAAIVGLAAGFYFLWKRSETFRNIVIGTWNAIKSAAISVYGFIKPYIMQAIGAVVSYVQQKMTVLKTFWSQNGAMILEAGKNVWGFLVKVIGGALKGIWAVMKFVWPLALAIVKSVWANIKGIIDGALNIIMGLVKVFGGLFTGDFTKVWKGVKQIFFGAIKVVWNYVNLLLFGKILKAGKVFYTGFKTIITTVWSVIKSLFKNGIKGTYTFLYNGFKAMNKASTNFMNLIKDTVTTRFKTIVDAAKALPEKIGNGIKGMAGKAWSGIKHFGNKMNEGMAKVINGATSGLNWAMGKLSIDFTIPNWTPPKYAKGTNYHPGGPAIVGERGRELINANGHTFMANKQMMLNLPAGSSVLTNSKTEKLLASGMPGYHSGVGKAFNGAIKGAGKIGGKIADGAKGVAGNAYDGAKDVAGAAKDKALDVWGYMSNPKALVTKLFEKYGVKFPQMSGGFGKFGTGSVKLMKDKSVEFMKAQFANLTSFSGDSGDPGKVGPGSGFGGMHKYVEAAYNDVKNRFGATRFMGGYNNRNVRGGSTKSMHAYGRAFDIGGSASTMHAISRYLQKYKNIENVIYNRQISSRGGSWRNYSGVNPHTDHVHADFKALANVGKSNVSGNVQAWIKAGMARAGVSGSNWENGLGWIINKESSGNPRAVGASTSDGRAKGLMQLKPFNIKGDPFDPVNNIHHGIKYIRGRYNSIEGALNWWRSHNWYAKGTSNHPGGPSVLGDGKKNELFKTPDGMFGMSPATKTMMNLPKKSKVLSGNQTQEVFEDLSGGASNTSRTFGNIEYRPTVHVTIQGNANGSNATDIKKAVQDALDEQWQRFISIYGIEVIR